MSICYEALTLRGFSSWGHDETSWSFDCSLSATSWGAHSGACVSASRHSCWIRNTTWKKDPMFFKDFCVNIIVIVLECNHFINADKCRYMHIQTLHVRNICLPLFLNLIKTFMWVNMPVPSMEHLRDSSLNAWFIRSNHVSRSMFKNWRFFSPWYKPANCSEEWKFLPEITRWCKIKIYLGLFGAPILLSPLN